MIAVTGAIGFLGNALVRALAAHKAQAGDPVTAGPLRAVVRRTSDRSPLAGIDVEFVEAGLHDVEALTGAFWGAEVVVHTAGIVSIEKETVERLRPVNVEGTRAVIEACRRAGVRRLVYTSSIHALVEPPKGTCIDESAPIDPARLKGAYGITKAEATRLVLAAAREGLETVVVFPTGVIGPYDFRPSNTGEAIIAAVQGRLMAYVHGAYNFVDVRDVADGVIAACERGRPGEGYLLAGHEVSVWDLLHTIAEVSGVPAPRLRLNLRFLKTVSPLIPAYYWATRQKPLFTKYSLEVLSSNCCISHAKAAQELGFCPRPFRETISDTIHWFKEQRML